MPPPAELSFVDAAALRCRHAELPSRLLRLIDDYLRGRWPRRRRFTIARCARRRYLLPPLLCFRR